MHKSVTLLISFLFFSVIFFDVIQRALDYNTCNRVVDVHPADAELFRFFFNLIGADDWATVAQMGLVSGKFLSSRAQLNF